VSDKPPNGSSEPTDAEILDAMRQEISLHLGLLLGLFAPTFPPSQLPALVELLVQEQLVIQQQVMPTLVKGGGELYIDVQGRNNSKGRFTAQRSLGSSDGDCGIALSTALVYAFCFQPAVRGLLRVFGVGYQFVAPSRKPDPQLKLIV
jgi:hypothetical protein